MEMAVFVVGALHGAVTLMWGIIMKNSLAAFFGGAVTLAIAGLRRRRVPQARQVLRKG